MPEGPEVETVRRGLIRFRGKAIKQVSLSGHKKYTEDLLLLEGRTIDDIRRVGKILVWQFGDLYATNRLGMTGIWRINGDPAKHWKVSFKIEGGAVLTFIDARTFGSFSLHHSIEEVETIPYIRNIGPDMLAQPFDTEEFVRKVRGSGRNPRRQEIGRMLLDPSVVAGCGNIYKSEALYRARINPFAPANELEDEDLRRLGIALSEVGTEALNNGGSTLQDFRNVEGYSGLMQNQFSVYQRDGEPCTCGAVISSRVQGGRRTFYCPDCQS